MAIDFHSVRSLFIEMFFGATPLACGTGFIVESRIGPVLITNRHNVTGQDNNTGANLRPDGGRPDRLRVWIYTEELRPTWAAIDIALQINDRPTWHEHPTLGPRADFVGIKLLLPQGLKTFPYNVGTPDRPLQLRPSEQVTVIGFPFGKAAGGLYGIWATGSLASEMLIDYEDLPIFLIDCRTRMGQSGSPVVAIRNGGTVLADGTFVQPLDGGQFSEFLGIYSGRIHRDSDIGKVWKRSAIEELTASLR